MDTLATEFSGIILQPTTFCNLNCSYCYLPNRRDTSRMSVGIAERVAEAIDRQQRSVQVIWHGGEPLTIGVEEFARRLEPFAGLVDEGLVKHCVQTNATLITDEFCDLFLRHQFTISVSIDGPSELNRFRRNWSGRTAFPAIMRGICVLNRRRLPFGAIAVVSGAALDRGRDLYDFATELGCHVLGIALEETKGINAAKAPRQSNVSRFWEDLIGAWKERPEIKIREVDRFLAWAHAVSRDEWSGWRTEAFPCVASNGDVSLLSPEFVNIGPQIGGADFVVGNLTDTELEVILEKGRTAPYVVDYLQGVDDCRRDCAYFSYCGGGAASNKYFELGSTRGTTTSYCTNRVQRFADVALELLIPEQRRE